MTDLQRAERSLLRAAKKGTVVPSATLLAAAEKAQPSIPEDTVRFAYWTLVSEGKLERLPEGVRKKG